MLEDFFTLTEMKDGISTVARIGELVSEIKKLKSAVELNTADLIRQCATAANTLASTKNEECLQHFVQLNGVGFLHQWLQDAQNCGDDISNAAEDLIVAVLTALECLPVEKAQITSCGVLHTVNHLLGHKNIDINKKAGALCHKWNGVPKCSSDVHEMVAREHDPDQVKLSESRLQSQNDRHDGSNEAAIVGDKPKNEVMVCSSVPLPNHSQTNDHSDPLVLIPANSDGKAILGDGNPSVASVASHSGLENVPVIAESSATNDVKIDAAHVSPSDVTTEAKSSGTNNPEYPLVSNKIDVQDQNVSTSLDIKKGESFSEDMPHSEKNTVEGLNLSPALQDSSDDESTGKEEGPTSSSDTDVKGAVNELRLKRCMTSFGDSSKAVDKKFTADKGDTSRALAEYDDTDALEVARLVAIEVEREVIDYRGPFCGSPDINSRRSDSPDLEARRQPEPPVPEPDNDNKSSTTAEDSRSSSSMKEDGSGITDDSGTFSRKHTRNMKLGGIDLNENQCAEEVDCHTKSTLSNSINLSTPIAVAASRTSSVFPARLHFEGELGWKGSAATSAFRPASPRRTPDGEKSVYASSQKTGNALFDLNVSESDNATGEPLSGAILPLISDLVPKDASATVGVNTSLELDLNCPCDDEEAAITTSNVPLFWNRQQCNGDWSHASSSSSSRQPAVRNFDLNDNTPIVDSFSRAVDESSVKPSGRDVADHSAVTILGKRIVLGQKEHSHQSEHNFLGPSVESRDPARSMQSFAHTPSDYGVVSYPSQPALSFPPPFYAPGTVPYMVDAKGTPVIPQLPGFGIPTMPSLGVGTSHPPFSSRGIPPSSSEMSYFHPSMDVNYGRSYEGGRREGASYWPVSYQGQTMFMDDRGKISQGGSSGVPVLKRKEPDSGWDLYPRR
uniref:TFIIS N-terminal domain-containing protein n=1 Tax=Leersia perrieri TaxID=77586 RepID=A0A0D9WSB4_9ORYZ